MVVGGFALSLLLVGLVDVVAPVFCPSALLGMLHWLRLIAGLRCWYLSQISGAGLVMLLLVVILAKSR